MNDHNILILFLVSSLGVLLILGEHFEEEKDW